MVDVPVASHEVRAAGATRPAQALLGAVVVAVALVDVGLTTRGHVLAGTIADGVLLVALLNLATWQRTGSEAVRVTPVNSAIYAIALLPLARIVGAGMPVAQVSRALADLMVAVPVGYAALRFAPVVGVSVGALLRGATPTSASRRPSRTDVAVATGGGLLGLIAYLLGAPSLVPAGSSVGRVALAVAAVALVVLVEELVFRGLLQTALQRVAGRLGFVAATTLFACGYLGAGSAGLVLTVVLTGVVLAYGFAESGDLRSALAGHWEFAVGAFIVWPALFGRSNPTWLEGSVTTAGLALAVVLVLGASLRRPIFADPPLEDVGAGGTETADPKAW